MVNTATARMASGFPDSMNLFWEVMIDMKPIEFHGQIVDMGVLTDGWKIGKSDAEYRLWKLTRAPLDEVKVFVAQCYEDHAKELKLIAEMQKTLNTQYCPVCGTGYDRGLHKCPHCEKIELAEFQKNLKAQRKAQRAEDFNRFMNTADEVIEVGNGFFRCIGKLLSIVFFPIAIIAMFLGVCIDAQERGGRRRYSSRRRRRF